MAETNVEAQDTKSTNKDKHEPRQSFPAKLKIYRFPQPFLPSSQNASSKTPSFNNRVETNVEAHNVKGTNKQEPIQNVSAKLKMLSEVLNRSCTKNNDFLDIKFAHHKDFEQEIINKYYDVDKLLIKNKNTHRGYSDSTKDNKIEHEIKTNNLSVSKEMECSLVVDHNSESNRVTPMRKQREIVSLPVKPLRSPNDIFAAKVPKFQIHESEYTNNDGGRRNVTKTVFPEITLQNQLTTDVAELVDHKNAQHCTSKIIKLKPHINIANHRSKEKRVQSMYTRPAHPPQGSFVCGLNNVKEAVAKSSQNSNTFSFRTDSEYPPIL